MLMFFFMGYGDMEHWLDLGAIITWIVQRDHHHHHHHHHRRRRRRHRHRYHHHHHHHHHHLQHQHAQKHMFLCWCSVVFL